MAPKLPQRTVRRLKRLDPRPVLENAVRSRWPAQYATLRAAIPSSLSALPASLTALPATLRSVLPASLADAQAALLSAFPEPARARVQQFGESTLDRVVKRWPALGELLDARLGFRRPSARRTSAGSVKSPSGHVMPVTAPTLEALLQQLTDDAWDVRAHAASTLAHFDDESALTALLETLRDSSADVAAAAAEALTDKRDPRARRALVDVLTNSNAYFHTLTRVAAVHALAKSELENELTPLRNAIMDATAEVSLAAIAAFATHPNASAVATLKHVVQDRSGFFLPEVRLAALRSLA